MPPAIQSSMLKNMLLPKNLITSPSLQCTVLLNTLLLKHSWPPDCTVWTVIYFIPTLVALLKSIRIYQEIPQGVKEKKFKNATGLTKLTLLHSASL